MHCSQYYDITVPKESAGSGFLQLAEMCHMGKAHALSVKILLAYLKMLCSECFLADSIQYEDFHCTCAPWVKNKFHRFRKRRPLLHHVLILQFYQIPK